MENDKRLEQKVVSARWRCSCWLEKRRTILKTAEEAPENALVLLSCLLCFSILKMNPSPSRSTSAQYIVGDGETSERIDEDNLR